MNGLRVPGRLGTASVLAFALAIPGVSCRSAPDPPGSPAATAASAGKEAPAPTVAVARVVSQRLEVTLRLPGELQPYEAVAVYPKVTGFIDWIGVDRGTRVRKGDLLARLVAPEIASQRAEAESKLQGAQAERIEAESRLSSDEATYGRIRTASATPGVVSGNELEVAQKTVEAGRARVMALTESERAARAALSSIEQIEGYLSIRAPFDGIVTERGVHEGALVGPAGGPGATVPIVRVETVSRLRLVVSVPEVDVPGIPEGLEVGFVVPAFPGETFKGTIARISHSLEPRTRTMPVELDVADPSGRLAAGMFPEVLWPMRRDHPTLFVPSTSVTRTTQHVFVVRIRDGVVEQVEVKPTAASGDLTEVFGDLKEGDEVAVHGTDELRPGMRVTARRSS